MFIKIILSTLIIAGCTSIGYIYSLTYTQRVKDLQTLNNIIQHLETEIFFVSTRLVDALEKAGSISPHGVGNILIELSRVLNTKVGHSIKEAFNIIIKKTKHNTFLHKDDIDILSNLFSNLGYIDKEHQRKFFESFYLEIERQKKEAYEHSFKYGNLYRKVGALVGIAIVVVFI